MAHLYTILFSNGLIKVGMTKGSPAKRMVQHAAAMSITDVTICKSEHVECNSDTVMQAERLLVEKCKNAVNSEKKSKEWFYGLEFDTVVEWMLECAASLNSEKENTQQIDIDALSVNFEEEARRVVHCALFLHQSDEETLNAVMDGIGRSRSSMMVHCWNEIDRHASIGLGAESSVLLLVKDIAGKLCFDFVFGHGR